MRTAIMAANWKMHKTAAEAVAFAEAFLPLVAEAADVEIVVAAPFTALDRLGRALDGSAVALAAQNVNAEPQGAFTGEVAPGMLVELGCRYGIVGHSERRSLYGESDATVASKALALLAAGIRPILCVGETLEERESGRTLEVIGGSLAASLAGVPGERADELVIAYEPVWAIGTGKTATPQMAQEVHGFIRSQLAERFGDSAESMRIQYGGSVKPDNVAEIMAQPDIDGALVGGASLDPDNFSKIARFAQQES
ncbi:MAG: triose-phosphate isomerase [Deltaproteobacteria bacterium]|nr:triose-phosphate isomerase [Deltaproteobacteria bacterium]MBW2418490.1 triose-phosphate isomerase [Deltaproteobacteria bacterium]